MLGLSRARAGGAHPYLMPSEHTRAARETIGEERLLAPEEPAALIAWLRGSRPVG